MATAEGTRLRPARLLAPGAPRCGATTREGTPCKNPALVLSPRCRMHGGRSLRGTLSPCWRHGRDAPLFAYTGGAQDKRMQPWIARRLEARGSKARVHWELRRWQEREFAYFQGMQKAQRERGRTGLSK